MDWRRNGLTKKGQSGGGGLKYKKLRLYKLNISFINNLLF